MASAEEPPLHSQSKCGLSRVWGSASRWAKFIPPIATACYAGLHWGNDIASEIREVRENLRAISGFVSPSDGKSGPRVAEIETGSIEPAPDMPPAIAPGCIAPDQFSPLIIGKLPATKRGKKKAISEPAKEKPLLEKWFGAPPKAG